MIYVKEIRDMYSDSEGYSASKAHRCYKIKSHWSPGRV